MNIFKKKRKIFCIGAGKTGTTSVEKVLVDFGYKMGDQIKGELLLNDYASRNFKAIVKFCKSAEAFQDAPFCYKHTYVALDQAFSNSKFILTIRDSEDQWYNSLVTFHSKLFAKNLGIPNINDLKNSSYRYMGYLWEVRQKVYGITENDNPYDEKILKNYYLSHNQAVMDYFKNKKNLLVINVSEPHSYAKLCAYLGQKPLYKEFPWENKTSEI